MGSLAGSELTWGHGIRGLELMRREAKGILASLFALLLAFTFVSIYSTSSLASEVTDTGTSTEENEDPNTGALQGEPILPLSADKAHLKKFAIASVVDGVAPFDTSDDPDDPYYKLRDGNDENDHNLRVRSFDSISYDISFVAEAYQIEQKFSEAALCFEFVLPLEKNQAEWDIASMAWMDPNPTIEEKEVTFDFDGDGTAETKTCQVLRGQKTLTKTDAQPTAIPGAGVLNAVVKVKNMLKGETVQPVFTGWVEYNKSGEVLIDTLDVVTGQAEECAEHNTMEAVTCRPAAVTVTSDLRYNVQLLPMSDNFAAIDTYDFSLGNDKALDKSAGSVTGRADAFGITIQLYNNPDRGFKGLELPVGPITFDVNLNTKFKPSTEGDTLTDEQQTDVAQNYAPLVYSFGPQAEPSVDQRPLGELSSYAVSTAPKNSGMKESPSLSCYKGGTWSAEKSSNVVHFTVQDYEIKYNTFPNGNLGDALDTDRYFDPEVGVQNIGCFSGGQMWVVTPFYNNGTTDPAKKGTFILDEYKKSGNFETSIQDVNLRASSQSGRALKHVTDNSNQMNQNDDKAVRTVYVARGGEFDWRIAWTTMQESVPSWAFSDVLGRASHVKGSWALNGQDVAVRKQDLAIGLGLHASENADKKNRVIAANILAKFDAEVVDPTTESASSGVSKFGLKYTLLYGTKPDGTNWTSQDEMDHAKTKDLKYYTSPADIPAGHQCVALLAEVRPKDNNPDNVLKDQQGSRIMIAVKAQVKNDTNLIDRVFSTVVGGEIYTRETWDACSGNIPSLLENDPSNPLLMPTPTFADYRTYEKAFYDESGYAGGHTGHQNYGDSLRIQKVVPSIIKNVAQQEVGRDKDIYQMDSDQRYVDFVLKPSLKGLPEGVVETTTLTIEDTLDKHLQYVDGSAFIGGTYTQHEQQGRPGTVTGGQQLNPAISLDENGCTVLTWTLKNVSSADDLAPLHYTCLIGTPGNDSTDVQNNQTLRNLAFIRGEDDLRAPAISTGNLSKADILIAKLKLSAISKVADKKYYNPGDGMGYELSAGNNGSSAIHDVVVLDTLPYNGDSIGSVFEGTLTVGDLKFNPEALSNAAEWEAYYTTDVLARNTVSAQYAAEELRNGLSLVSGHEIPWTKAEIEADGNVKGVENKAITAFAFVGSINPKEAVKAHLNLINGESQSGNLFINVLSQGDNQTAARVYVVQREIEGMPWLDLDKDGQQSPDEKPLYGVKVTLAEKQSDGSYAPVVDVQGKTVSVETSQTASEQDFYIVKKNNLGENVQVKLSALANADGTYRFIGVPEGTFGVLFESGSTKLDNFVASPVNVGSDLTDSDGVPLYSNNQETWTAGATLLKTQIPDIAMPQIDDMLGTYYVSLNNDSGFYTDKISVTAQKKWVGGAQVRPQSVTFKLYRDGQYLGETYDRTLPGDKDSEVTWTDLDSTDSAGHAYTYTVEEVAVAGFTTSQDGNVLTNTYESELTNVVGKKIWAGGEERPEIYLTLYRHIAGGEDELALDAQGNPYIKKVVDDKAEFTALPLTDADGNPYTYSVKETDKDGHDFVPEGYTKVEDGMVVTNTYTEKKPEFTDLVGKKIWVGGEDRPEIYLTLYRKIAGGTDEKVLDEQGTPYIQKVVDEQAIFSRLPLADEDGNPYLYSVRETDKDGNDFVPEGYIKVEEGMVVTNAHVPPVPHEPTNPDTPPPSKPTEPKGPTEPPLIPKTGDIHNGWYAILVALAGAAFVTRLVVKRSAKA